MKIKIWQKLAIAIVLISTVIVSATSLLSMQSFSKGFLSYVNELEKPKIESLKRRLETSYQKNGSWEFLLSEPEAWSHYLRGHQLKGKLAGRLPPFGEPPPPLRDSRRPPRSKDGPPRHGNEGFRPPPPMRGEDRLPLHIMAERSENQASKKEFRPEGNLSLLDKDRKIIAGRMSSDDLDLDHAISFKGKVVGYLHVDPFVKLTDDLDQQFLEQQQLAFVKISLFALFLSLIGAWVLARYFHKRLIPLTNLAQDYSENDYSARIHVKQEDELGQLATDLNLLGRTLEQNQTARQQWIADISHELRTPLSILGGELEALEDGIRPLNTQAIHSLSSEVKHLKKLVEDLYQLSLSDLGALHYSWETIDLGVVLDDAAEHFRTRFAERSLSILNKCENTLMVSGDQNRLYQLFTNLLENSYRYTDEGGEIQISCELLNNQVIVRIADSSPGVPEDQLLKMFDRLHRVEKSRNRATGGAGLGLTIVKTIVEAHNGSVYSQASALGGLEVVINIPSVVSR